MTQMFLMVHGPLPKWTQEYRACGQSICEVCGLEYFRHPFDFWEVGYDDNLYLHVLCNGDRVKL
jgi:hypothetical protein